MPQNEGSPHCGLFGTLPVCAPPCLLPSGVTLSLILAMLASFQGLTLAVLSVGNALPQIRT